ncbi:MAG: Uma2 family endonuclease [Fimbriimonas sp.]
MAAPHSEPVTPEAYLREERAAEFRHELVNGVVYAMSGASRGHVRIVGNLHFALRSQLSRRCEIFLVDMRVKVDATGMYTYPDLSIVCGEPTFEDEAYDTLTNPLVLIEVLSPSTESYDRGAKFLHYKTIPSLHAYVLVSQALALVEVFVRGENGDWTHHETLGRSGRAEIPPLGIALDLADVYEGLEVPDTLPGRSDVRPRDVQ